MKRSIDVSDGLKWVERGSKALVLGGRACRLGDETPLEAVEKRARQLGEVKVENGVVTVLPMGVKLRLEGRRVLIDAAKEDDRKKVIALFS